MMLAGDLWRRGCCRSLQTPPRRHTAGIGTLRRGTPITWVRWKPQPREDVRCVLLIGPLQEVAGKILGTW